MKRWATLAIGLSAATLHAQPAGRRPVDPETLGQAQANIWVPVDTLTQPTATARREAMVAHIRRTLAARGSTLPPAAVERVLAAMRTIAREDFVGPEASAQAYLPTSLDIGYGQTISDPYIVALMTAAAGVKRGDRVLDIGTGSGYQAALLARLGGRVHSVEIVPELARAAGERLRRLGYRTVSVAAGDGFAGAAGRGPFDVIVVAAGTTAVPSALLAQLKPGGRMVIPVGPSQLTETLLVVTKTRDGRVTRCSLGRAAFVPLVGDATRTPAGPSDPVPLCYGRPIT